MREAANSKLKSSNPTKPTAPEEAIAEAIKRSKKKTQPPFVV